MSSKERLCVECGRHIGRWLVSTKKWGPLHLRCYLRTDGPFFRDSEEGARMQRLLNAFGIGRPVEPLPPRRPDHRYIVGQHVSLVPWRNRFRFGYVLSVVGPYRHTAVGVVGRDWNDGKWLGGMSWTRRGPIAYCRWGRRGSWRSDRWFARVMTKPTITADDLTAYQSMTSDLECWEHAVHDLVVERVEALQAVHPEDRPGGETAREWAERVLAKGQYPMPETERDRRGYEYVQASYGTITYSGPYTHWTPDGEDYVTRIARISVPAWVITDPDGPDRYRAETDAMVAAARAERDALDARLDEIMDRIIAERSEGSDD